MDSAEIGLLILSTSETGAEQLPNFSKITLYLGDRGGPPSTEGGPEWCGSPKTDWSNKNLR